MIALQSVWGWEPALYLFLGGLGAGTFVCAATVWLASKEHRKPVVIGMWAAVACLCVGLGLLIVDLAKPFTALAMWRSFSHVASSWMAIGAWVLFAAVIVFAICAALLTFKRFAGKESAANVLAVIGILLGVGVAAYTGILLKSAPGIPFWNTWLLPCLLLVSAMDTGVALMAIFLAAFEPAAARVRRNLEASTVVLVLAEIGVLTWFLSFMKAGGEAYYHRFAYGVGETAAASANAVLAGQLSGAFWILVVGLGLALPLLVAAIELVAMRKAPAKPEEVQESEQAVAKRERIVPIVGAAGALVGGCALRFVVLLAGAHANIVLDTIASIL